MQTVEGWITKRFDEIGTIFSGSTPSTSVRSFWNGEIVWVTPNDLSKLNTPYLSDSDKRITVKGLDGCSAHLLSPGSIVMSSRAPIGYVAIPTVEFCTNQGCKSIQLKENFTAEFTYYNILFNVDKVKNLGEGTTFAEISKTALSTVELAFPSSKPEQTKIAEILSTVDRAIEQTEALIAKQQRIKTGLMQDILTRGIDEHGSLRTEKTHKFKDFPLGRIPVEWDATTLKSLSRGGAQNGYFKKPEIVGSGYKLINVSEIYQSFGIDTDRDSVERVDATPSDLLKYGVTEGDLFFTRSSLVLEGIAHCNIIRTVKEPTLFECHVIRIQPDKMKIVPEFLAIQCQSHRSRLFLMSRAKHVTMTTISQPELEELSIPVPSNPEEQQAIVDTMLSNDRAIRHNEVQRSKLWHIKTALMQDLLTGKIRVTPLLNSTMPTN